MSEKSNGKIIKVAKFPFKPFNYKNRSMNFTPSFLHRYKDLEQMLPKIIELNISTLFSSQRAFRDPLKTTSFFDLFYGESSENLNFQIKFISIEFPIS